MRNIKSYFEGVIENIDIILTNDFYENKNELSNVKKEIMNWYDKYNKSSSLKNIEPEKLKEIDLEITDFFAQYVATESVKENYAERLSYDFSILEQKWKEEMLGGNENVRR